MIWELGVKYYFENLKGMSHLEDIAMDRRTLLKCTVKVMWKDVDWIHLGPVLRYFEHCNKSFGAVKGGKFLVYTTFIMFVRMKSFPYFSWSWKVSLCDLYKSLDVCHFCVL